MRDRCTQLFIYVFIILFTLFYLVSAFYFIIYFMICCFSTFSIWPTSLIPEGKTEEGAAKEAERYVLFLFCFLAIFIRAKI